MITRENLIKDAIDLSLSNVNIAPIKYFNRVDLPPGFITLHLKNNEITVAQKHDYLDPTRINITANLIQRSTQGLNLDCKIILNTKDEHTKFHLSIFEFACPEDSLNIRINDPHSSFYVGKNFFDPTPFDLKEDSLVFRGTDTGKLNEQLTNQRIEFCKNTASVEHINSKISQFLNHNKEAFDYMGYDMDLIAGDYLDKEAHFKYKYILDMYGHTSAWDRNFWALGSNSVLCHMKPNEIPKLLWYYRYIQKEGIVPEFTEDEFINKDHTKINIKEVKEKQKSFSKILLDPETHEEYCRTLLFEYNKLYNE